MHSDEPPAGVDDEVVAIAVAVGLGDRESQAGGLPYEGELSAAFRRAFADVSGRAFLAG